MPRRRRGSYRVDVTLSVCEDCYLTAHGADSVPRSEEAIAGMAEEYGLSSPHDLIFGTAGDPYFSWDMCELCGSTLGGNRYDVRIVSP